VHDEVAPLTGWAYTTTKTVMDRMTAKRLLARQREDGTYTYVPLISRPAGLARMVRFFADRILETDRLSVVSMFKGKGVLTEDEVDELARLIEDDGRMGED
jgi:BlaI family penicillinase repressor